MIQNLLFLFLIKIVNWNPLYRSVLCSKDYDWHSRPRNWDKGHRTYGLWYIFQSEEFSCIIIGRDLTLQLCQLYVGEWVRGDNYGRGRDQQTGASWPLPPWPNKKEFSPVIEIGVPQVCRFHWMLKFCLCWIIQTFYYEQKWEFSVNFIIWRGKIWESKEEDEI